MGDATRPPYPLVAQRGGTAVPPLWKPLPETRDGAGKTNPQGDEGRETRIKPETDRVVRSEAERTGVEIRRFSFAPRCATGFLVRGCSSGWSRYSAAGRRLPDLVGSAWRPAPVLGELTASPVNSSPSAFSFVPCPARFLFGKTKRKCGGHSARQSRAFPCRIAAPWFIPAAIRRTFWVLPFRENHSKEPCNGQT